MHIVDLYFYEVIPIKTFLQMKKTPELQSSGVKSEKATERCLKIHLGMVG